VNDLEAGIVGRDREVLLPFYVDVLGFEIVHRLDFPDGHLVKLRRDAARLKIFFPVTPPATPGYAEPYWELAGWRYAALLFDDRGEMHDVFARVDHSTGRVVMAPQRHRPGAEAGLVADPEGNVWELLWDA
jgi:catechol 2,3-dioxygenase-like lactoylglutathione lyase family enzyme